MISKIILEKKGFGNVNMVDAEVTFRDMSNNEIMTQILLFGKYNVGDVVQIKYSKDDPKNAMAVNIMASGKGLYAGFIIIIILVGLINMMSRGDMEYIREVFLKAFNH